MTTIQITAALVLAGLLVTAVVLDKRGAVQAFQVSMWAVALLLGWAVVAATLGAPIWLPVCYLALAAVTAKRAIDRERAVLSR